MGSYSSKIQFVAFSSITERELIKWEGIGILYSSLILFACNLFFRYENMEQKAFDSAMSLCVILFFISLGMIATAIFNYIPLSDGISKVVRRVFMYAVMVMLVCAIFVTFGCTKCAEQFAVFALLLQVAILLSMVVKDYYTRLRNNSTRYSELSSSGDKEQQIPSIVIVEPKELAAIEKQQLQLPPKLSDEKDVFVIGGEEDTEPPKSD